MKLNAVSIEFNCPLEDLLVPGYLNKEFKMILSSPMICTERDAESLLRFYNLNGEFWEKIEFIDATHKNGKDVLYIERKNGVITLKLYEKII